MLTTHGQARITLEKNITLKVEPRKVKETKPLHSGPGQVTFSLDIERNQEDQVNNVFWILRREIVLSEGRTVCLSGITILSLAAARLYCSLQAGQTVSHHLA